MQAFLKAQIFRGKSVCGAGGNPETRLRLLTEAFKKTRGTSVQGRRLNTSENISGEQGNCPAAGQPFHLLSGTITQGANASETPRDLSSPSTTVDNCDTNCLETFRLVDSFHSLNEKSFPDKNYLNPCRNHNIALSENKLLNRKIPPVLNRIIDKELKSRVRYLACGSECLQADIPGDYGDKSNVQSSFRKDAIERNLDDFWLDNASAGSKDPNIAKYTEMLKSKSDLGCLQTEHRFIHTLMDESKLKLVDDFPEKEFFYCNSATVHVDSSCKPFKKLFSTSSRKLKKTLSDDKGRCEEIREMSSNDKTKSVEPNKKPAMKDRQGWENSNNYFPSKKNSFELIFPVSLKCSKARSEISKEKTLLHKSPLKVIPDLCQDPSVIGSQAFLVKDVKSKSNKVKKLTADTHVNNLTVWNKLSTLRIQNFSDFNELPSIDNSKPDFCDNIKNSDCSTCLFPDKSKNTSIKTKRDAARNETKLQTTVDSNLMVLQKGFQDLSAIIDYYGNFETKTPINSNKGKSNSGLTSAPNEILAINESPNLNYQSRQNDNTMSFTESEKNEFKDINHQSANSENNGINLRTVSTCAGNIAHYTPIKSDIKNVQNVPNCTREVSSLALKPPVELLLALHNNHELCPLRSVQFNNEKEKTQLNHFIGNTEYLLYTFPNKKCHPEHLSVFKAYLDYMNDQPRFTGFINSILMRKQLKASNDNGNRVHFLKGNRSHSVRSSDEASNQKGLNNWKGSSRLGFWSRGTGLFFYSDSEGFSKERLKPQIDKGDDDPCDKGAPLSPTSCILLLAVMEITRWILYLYC